MNKRLAHPLFDAIEEFNNIKLELFLQNNSHTINTIYKIDGEDFLTPLHYATLHDNEHACMMMINYGIDEYKNGYSHHHNIAGTAEYFAYKLNKNVYYSVFIHTNYDRLTYKLIRMKDIIKEQEELKTKLKLKSSYHSICKNNYFNAKIRLNNVKNELNDINNHIISDDNMMNLYHDYEIIKKKHNELKPKSTMKIICFICTLKPSAEIYSCNQCYKFTCHDCFNKVKKCPFCRSDKKNLSRNRTIENLI